MSAVGFRHEALLYAGEDEFVAAAVPFVRAALADREPVLVAVSARKIDRLRAELGADADRVGFADMAVLGANPARIIPAWREFVDAAPGGRARGIGEPISPDRHGEELVECHCHEALLNVAFADDAGFRLMCPYDTSALPDAVVADALCTHPILVEADRDRASDAYAGDPARFAGPLPEPDTATASMRFAAADLSRLRAVVAERAEACGLPRERREDLLLAANEAATNSIRHGGGRGTLRLWETDDAVVCKIRDAGRITDPLVGRRRPAADQVGGYGMWMLNQLCELVQVRSTPDGTVVRMHVRR